MPLSHPSGSIVFRKFAFRQRLKGSMHVKRILVKKDGSFKALNFATPHRLTRSLKVCEWNFLKPPGSLRKVTRQLNIGSHLTFLRPHFRWPRKSSSSSRCMFLFPVLTGLVVQFCNGGPLYRAILLAAATTTWDPRKPYATFEGKCLSGYASFPFRFRGHVRLLTKGLFRPSSRFTTERTYKNEEQSCPLLLFFPPKQTVSYKQGEVSFGWKCCMQCSWKNWCVCKPKRLTRILEHLATHSFSPFLIPSDNHSFHSTRTAYFHLVLKKRKHHSQALTLVNNHI